MRLIELIKIFILLIACYLIIQLLMVIHILSKRFAECKLPKKISFELTFTSS